MSNTNEQDEPRTQSGEGPASGDEEGGGESTYTPQGRANREDMPPGADTPQDDPSKA